MLQKEFFQFCENLLSKVVLSVWVLGGGKGLVVGVGVCGFREVKFSISSQDSLSTIQDQNYGMQQCICCYKFKWKGKGVKFKVRPEGECLKKMGR